MRRSRALAAVVAVAALASGCSGGGDASADEEPSESPTPSPAGTHVGRLGERVGVEGVALRASELGKPLTVQSVGRFVPLRVELCVRKDSPFPTVNTLDAAWIGRDARGGEYAQNWSDFGALSAPKPTYPVNREVPAGSCAQGWTLLEAPKGVRLVDASVVRVSTGEVIATWKLPR